MSGCRAVSRQIIDNKRKRLTTAAAAAAAAVDVGGLTGLFLSLSPRSLVWTTATRRNNNKNIVQIIIT